MRRRDAVLVFADQRLVQLLAGTQPREANHDVSTAVQLLCVVAHQVDDVHRLAHVQDKELAGILRELNPGFFKDEICEDPRESVASLSSSIRNDLKSVETEIKYAGYLSQQQRAIDRLKKSEQRSIPDWFDYKSVSGLSREMQEKLLKIRPRTLGHASRIPGVTPAAVSLVNVYIEIQAKRRDQASAL